MTVEVKNFNIPTPLRQTFRIHHASSDDSISFDPTLNAAFESKLALEDEGYESGSENFNIPSPLRRTSRIHHVSSDENIFLIQ